MYNLLIRERFVSARESFFAQGIRTPSQVEYDNSSFKRSIWVRLSPGKHGWVMDKCGDNLKAIAIGKGTSLD